MAQLYPQALGSSGTSGVPFPVPTIVGPWGSQSHITTDDQSVSASLFQAPSGAYDPMFNRDYDRVDYSASERTPEKTLPLLRQPLLRV
jgi:hypothetical protein